VLAFQCAAIFEMYYKPYVDERLCRSQRTKSHEPTYMTLKLLCLCIPLQDTIIYSLPVVRHSSSQKSWSHEPLLAARILGWLTEEKEALDNPYFITIKTIVILTINLFLTQYTAQIIKTKTLPLNHIVF
jgi:hypothetical protein